MKRYLVFAILTLIASPAIALENLDEMESREARRATNTFYSGESVGNSWVSQPESLVYTDTTTGSEVVVLTSTPNKSNVYYTDISPANPWSADGARLGFYSNRAVSAFSRTVGSLLDGTEGTSFVMRSDGAYLRPTIESSTRMWGSLGSNYFIWSPTIRDTFYAFGEAYNGLSLDEQDLYRNTVSDTSGARTNILSFPGADRYSLKKIISPDGSKILPFSGRTYFPTQVTGTASILDPDGWLDDRGQGDDWGGNDPFPSQHDMYFPSPDFAAILFSYDTYSGQPVMYKYNLTGSAADGGPLYDQTNATYTTFGEEEVEPLMSWGTGTLVPFDPDGTDSHGWGHPAFDRWGRVIVFNDGNGYWADNCSSGSGGPVAWDYVNREYLAQGSNPEPTSCPKVLVNKALSYIDWNAWSDYFGYASGTTGEIVTGKYDTASADGNWWVVANMHGNQNGGESYQWTSPHRPAQSPDGTKIATGLNFLTSVANTGDIGYVVAYYPHPPEITSVTGTGTYTIRWDWRTDQATSRGYTQRGWPDEVTDDPPPPRETKQFRLWRSADGTTWVPVSTVDAEIFERYNFATGAWTGSNYWTATDTPGAGPWYYAVTAVEWSGLESRVLSNVFSTAGSQTAAYPADPKADTGITGTYNKTLKRHYNIYAEDGATPTISQTNRIASIPVASGEEYVDWLGNTDGSTQYVVTAVDTQGNESGALSATYAHQESPATAAGQYTLRWNDGRRYAVRVNTGD